MSSHDHSGVYQSVNTILTSVSGLSTATTGLIKLTNGVASLDSTTYLTAISKSQVEAVLTGLISSHTHNYLTSYTETDPVYIASSWYSTTNNSTN